MLLGDNHRQRWEPREVRHGHLEEIRQYCKGLLIPTGQHTLIDGKLLALNLSPISIEPS